METVHHIGNREFRLDEQKARAAYAAKTVINGRQTTAFNLLPLRYRWAYDQYREMKSQHWGPMSAEVAMHVDVASWRGGELTPHERRLVNAVAGCLLATQPKGATDIQQIFRELVTAPELKLVLGREVHQQNLRMEAALYMIFSLGLNPHECEALFAEAVSAHIPAAAAPKLGRTTDLARPENRLLFAREIFHFGQCAKGVRHCSLFAVFLDLAARKMPGTCKMLGWILRDESSRIEVLRRLYLELVAENPELKSAVLSAELVALMAETVEMEKQLARRWYAGGTTSFDLLSLQGFIDYAAGCRLRSCELLPRGPVKDCPVPCLPGLLHLREPASAPARQVLQPCLNDDEL